MLVANLHRIARHADPQERIVLSGGLSRSGLFAERLACLSGLPVVPAPVAEATGLGLAWLVAGGEAGGFRAPGAAQDDGEIRPGTDAALADRYAGWSRAMAEATGPDPV